MDDATHYVSKIFLCKVCLTLFVGTYIKRRKENEAKFILLMAFHCLHAVKNVHIK